MASHNEEQVKSAQERMNAGSAWMSAASIISRVLGVLYIIPWMSWMGDPQIANEANALFNIGYKWYSIFIAIAIAGVPGAISKQIANYNARGQYHTAQRLFKSGFVLMAISGVVSAVLLWTLAPQLAANTPARSPEYAITVIRSLVPALAIIPILSIFRGFFQGYQDMKPSAVSQIMEQLFRVIYMLIVVYLLRVVSNGTMVTAVAHSTFAAFIGAIVAIASLLYYLFKNKSRYQIPEGHQDTIAVSSKSLLWEIIRVAIPFIIAGAAIEVSQLIDTNTFMPIMEQVSNLSQAELINQYAVFSANANKLVTVVVSLAISISSVSIPILSSTYTSEMNQQLTVEAKSWPDTIALVNHNIQLFALIMLPAATGMAAVAGPLYTMIYPYDPHGAWFLQISSIMAIAMGLFSVMVNNMQAMDYQKDAIFGMLIGMGVKLLLQYPLLAVFQTPGAMYATIIGFAVMSTYYLFRIKQILNFPYRQLLTKLRPIVLSTLVMAIVAFIANLGVSLVLPQPNRLGSLLAVAIVGIIGAWTYLLLGLRFRFIDLVLGEKADRLRQLFGVEARG
ncbi:putative polysaccharide biosynthesis protein [Aerococcus kribbianus]|uniref:Polysaccharide biosynthesis protein n=1 Tax=Aerococcus kribbianus TaxID=2999064 RepID=A0A9X3FVN9_9LACT|nr:MULTISPECIES: polysaccharide biosynthesis protein [unclassified Aerococcus]MCZ0717089.1 polysaccharide biosynthesis protein [Aerococcus sp. YH-aer221]MCZ0725377.1 polysaccharide biosynthesis protein [Aerococcus sp. YH-aer222]